MSTTPHASWTRSSDAEERVVPTPLETAAGITLTFSRWFSASEVLRRYRPIVLITTHGSERHREVTRLLGERGYSLEHFNADEILAHPRALI